MAGFFDKVVVGLNEGYNTAKEGSKLLVEKAKISTQIKDVEREKNMLLQNMGTLVYNLHLNGQIQVEQCTDMCSEVAALEQKIAELQQQLQRLEMPKSRQTQSPQPTNTQPIVNSGAVCVCGYVNKEGAKFCSKCGHPLDANE